VASTAASDAADPLTGVFDYRVSAVVLGNIGTYQNRIERHGDGLTITSTLRVLVEILGVVWHRENADRVERWEHDRLVYFDGLTKVNDKPWPVHGEARGDAFIVTSPDGTVTAPADVSSNNPHSCSFIHGKTIFAVNTGTVEPVQVSGGDTQIVDLGDRSAQARHYRVESARTHGQVWLDTSCVPVKMTVLVYDTDIALTLTRQTEGP
jgi:hypothetical protein